MKLTKTASVLAFIIGGMAVFAGGQVVLFGKVMDYYVIDWLPVYNLILGLLTVFLTAILIWKNSRLTLPAAIATLISHSTIMLILQSAYQDVVAPDSIMATTIRMVVWIIITSLLIVEKRKEKASL